MNEIVSEAKKALRLSVLGARNESQARATEDAFANSLLELVSKTRIQKVGCYLSFGSEPATGKFITLAAAQGIAIFAPRVLPDGSMVMAELTFETSLNSLGFREPTGKIVGPDELELLVIPALAIDFAGQRLGRGAGYFDRYLENYQSHTVGLVFDSEFVAKVPSLPHDRPVNQVVTPTRTISIPFEG